MIQIHNVFCSLHLYREVTPYLAMCYTCTKIAVCQRPLPTTIICSWATACPSLRPTIVNFRRRTHWKAMARLQGVGRLIISPLRGLCEAGQEPAIPCMYLRLIPLGFHLWVVLLQDFHPDLLMVVPTSTGKHLPAGLVSLGWRFFRLGLDVARLASFCGFWNYQFIKLYIPLFVRKAITTVFFFLFWFEQK